MSSYRGERWKLTWGQEPTATYGAAPAGQNVSNVFGVFDNATLPDPEFAHSQHWLFKTNVDRNPYIQYRGKAQYNGSIPDIILLDGRSLYLPMGIGVTHGGGTPTWTHQWPVTAGYTSTALPSFRVLATYSDSDGSTQLKRMWVGGKVNRATINAEESGMLTMSLDEIIFKRGYFEIASSTNEALVLPFYDIDVNEITPTWPSQITIAGTNYPQEPYYFSECIVTMKLIKYSSATASTVQEVTIPSVRNFRISIVNNLVPKYYLTASSPTALDDDAHGPYELVEGRQQISISMTVDLTDYSTGSFTKDDLFLNLLRQGRTHTASNWDAVTGVGLRITFTRANDSNDYIQFSFPANYGTGPVVGGDTTDRVGQGGLIIRAPHSVGGEDLIAVPLEMTARNMQLYISDHIDTATYPTQIAD